MDEDVPVYDPDIHTGDQVVQVAMWCTCGSALRQLDPVSYCLPQIASFTARHSGPGHGPATPGQALDEREARRQAAFRSTGAQQDYQPAPRPEVDDEHAAGVSWES